ncbi:hypothetical protein [Sphingomonas sp.]|uniref:hypothetical protein n=1 Tax=Sphingomonas sp. TaxID=28214 RepID=UPI003D6CA0C1
MSYSLAMRIGLIFLVVASGVAGRAHAQNPMQAYASAQADHLMITPGGVDARSGRYNYEETDLSIGGESGLQLTRLSRGGVWGHNEPFGNFTHNFDITIAEKRVIISKSSYSHYANRNYAGADYRMEIRYGFPIDTFDAYATYSTADRRAERAALRS